VVSCCSGEVLLVRRSIEGCGGEGRSRGKAL